MATISVNIDGKTYRMACDEGQEDHLSGLANKLDGYIQHLKASFGEIGDHRLSVMAGIMVMDEMTEQKEKMDKLRLELETLQESYDAFEREVNFREKQNDAALMRAASRIEELAGRIAPK